MRRQRKETIFFKKDNVFSLDDLDRQLPNECIKLCFKQLTDNEFDKLNTDTPAEFAKEYAVCTRNIKLISTIYF